MKTNGLREEYSKMLTLAVPVVLSQVGQLVVQFVDNAMVGHLGALPLAGVAFGGNIFFFLFIFGIGLAMGTTPLVGEMFSQGRHRHSAAFLKNSIWLYLSIGVVICAVQFATIPLFGYMGQPAEVIEQAIPYYRYLAWSMIPLMLFAAFKQFLEGVGNTRVAMVIVIVSNVVNVIFNYLLIYGKGGFPEMGAAGAGLSTLISRVLTPVLVIGYFFWNNSLRRYLVFYNAQPFSRTKIRELLAVGVPISAQMTLEGGAFALTGVMMGWFGTVALASNQIAVTMSNMAFLIVLSIGSAVTIRTSHQFGVQNFGGIRRVASASVRIAVAWNAFTALLFISCRNLLPQIFTTDPDVIALTGKLLVFVGIYQFSDGLQVIFMSLLRGMQDVKATSIVAFLSYIVVDLPIGYLLGFVLGFGPEGIFMGYIFGLTLAAVLLGTRYRRIVRRHEAAHR
jgi:MATE family multidrug resistance protein